MASTALIIGIATVSVADAIMPTVSARSTTSTIRENLNHHRERVDDLAYVRELVPLLDQTVCHGCADGKAQENVQGPDVLASRAELRRRLLFIRHQTLGRLRLLFTPYLAFAGYMFLRAGHSCFLRPLSQIQLQPAAWVEFVA